MPDGVPLVPLDGFDQVAVVRLQFGAIHDPYVHLPQARSAGVYDRISRTGHRADPSDSLKRVEQRAGSVAP